MTTSTTDTAKRLSDVELVKEFRIRAKTIRDWCAEHKAEEWAPMAQFEASLKEADDWDRAADAIERLSAPPSQGKVERAREIAEAFYEHIKHGDDKHRAWLKEECDGKLFDLVTQALTEPAQGTSVDDATVNRALKAWGDIFIGGDPDSEIPAMRAALEAVALPLPVSADRSAKRDAVIEECARWYDDLGWELPLMNVSAEMKRALKSTKHEGEGS